MQKANKYGKITLSVYAKEEKAVPKDVFIFKRVEKKYFLDEEKKSALLSLISEYLTPDEHGLSTVCNLYLDTPSFLLIRNSIDARTYKEKLRVRSYGRVDDDSKVFFEIKKKFKGVVYKRRAKMTYREVMEYIYEGKRPFDSQIMRELDWTMKFYGQPKPAVALYYDREAYYVKDMPALRITFDSRPRYRDERVCLKEETNGKLIIDESKIVMEIKTDGAMPLWLSAALDTLKIYPSSFSKYGTAYRDICKNEKINNKENLLWASSFSQ